MKRVLVVVAIVFLVGLAVPAWANSILTAGWEIDSLVDENSNAMTWLEADLNFGNYYIAVHGSAMVAGQFVQVHGTGEFDPSVGMQLELHVSQHLLILIMEPDFSTMVYLYAPDGKSVDQTAARLVAIE